MPFDEAVIVYRRRDLKLMTNTTDDHWYDPDATYASSCAARQCKQDDRFDLGHAWCNWTSFLFNVTADPFERTNLFHEPAYTSIVKDLLGRVRIIHDNQWWQNPSWGLEDVDAANGVFEDAGGYVAPWGCATSESTVERSSRRS